MDLSIIISDKMSDEYPFTHTSLVVPNLLDQYDFDPYVIFTDPEQAKQDPRFYSMLKSTAKTIIDNELYKDKPVKIHHDKDVLCGQIKKMWIEDDTKLFATYIVDEMTNITLQGGLPEVSLKHTQSWNPEDINNVSKFGITELSVCFQGMRPGTYTYEQQNTTSISSSSSSLIEPSTEISAAVSEPILTVTMSTPTPPVSVPSDVTPPAPVPALAPIAIPTPAPLPIIPPPVIEEKDKEMAIDPEEVKNEDISNRGLTEEQKQKPSESKQDWFNRLISDKTLHPGRLKVIALEATTEARREKEEAQRKYHNNLEQHRATTLPMLESFLKFIKPNKENEQLIADAKSGKELTEDKRNQLNQLEIAATRHFTLEMQPQQQQQQMVPLDQVKRMIDEGLNKRVKLTEDQLYERRIKELQGQQSSSSSPYSASSYSSVPHYDSPVSVSGIGSYLYDNIEAGNPSLTITPQTYNQHYERHQSSEQTNRSGIALMAIINATRKWFPNDQQMQGTKEIYENDFVTDNRKLMHDRMYPAATTQSTSSNGGRMTVSSRSI